MVGARRGLTGSHQDHLQSLSTIQQLHPQVSAELSEMCFRDQSADFGANLLGLRALTRAHHESSLREIVRSSPHTLARQAEEERG